MSKLPEFLEAQSLGCLCTSDEHGNPSGATVFFMVHNEKLYCMTHEDSLKVKQIRSNPKVCFVTANEIAYQQVQLYADAKIVNNPADYLPLLESTIRKYSLQTNYTIPYDEIKNEGHGPVVIELKPTRVKFFKSGEGLVEQKLP